MVFYWQTPPVPRYSERKEKEPKNEASPPGRKHKWRQIPSFRFKGFFFKLFDIISMKCKQRFQHISSESISLSDKSLALSLPSDFPKHTMCSCRCAKLSVPPLGHYFHSLIVLSTFCSIIVIQTVLVLLSKHRWVRVPALKSVYSRNKPFKFSTQDKTHQLQL